MDKKKSPHFILRTFVFRTFIFMAKAKKPKHIAVAGNIGAGKTTLTEMLSKHYRWIPQFEDVDHNPYLMDFYEDMPRWSFNLQIYFLNSRLNQLLRFITEQKP